MSENCARMTLFFYGPNAYAMRDQLSKMTLEYVKRTGSDFGLERIDGGSVKPRELLASLQAIPFLANSRLVVVENISLNKSGIKIDDLLAFIPSSTVAIFVETQIDRRTAAYKELSAADRAVEFKAISGPTLSAWIIAEVKRLGGSIERAAAIQLVELIGEDQWRLAEELNKLVNFGLKVTTQAVHELVVAGVEQSIFDLVDAMAAGQTANALNAYRKLLDKRENEIYILTMVQWQLRNLLWGVTAPTELTQAELAKAAGLSPFVAGKVLGARKRYSAGRIEAAYILASEAEFDIKSGRTKAETAVEQLIYRVAVSVSAKR
jgi:DNA polymerase III delta subunit